MQEDAAIRKKLVEAFGPSVFQHDGRLARQVLAERVFTNPANLRTLNRIVHPAVFARIGGMLEELPSERRRPYVIVEAALIYESGYDSELDYVVAVNADEAVRIRRIMKRDGCAEQAVRDRMQSQMNPEQIRKKADFVIINDGDPRALSPGVHLLHTLLSSLAAGRP
jgi:dephospho-CoA kinase